MSDLQLSELSARLWAGGSPREDLVTRVGDALRAQIEASGLRAGARLPSEAALARELRISRPTLREAIRGLAQEGLLDIRHGVGTFVAAPPPALHNPLDSMSSLTSAIRAAGGEPGVRSLSVDEVEPPAAVAAALRLPPGAPVVRIRRVRLIGDRPLGLAHEYLPSGDRTPLSALKAFDGGSLYAFLAETLKIRLLRSEMSVTAVGATAEQARSLAVKPGAPLLFMRETHFGENGEPILHALNSHNSAIIDLTLFRTGVRI
ncbi:MAG TPA: GntR family transcriptional regulator [Lichenihabitans sp.]|nr:GntR family transcriptional regulator [Lichenihabitans sp.]